MQVNTANKEKTFYRITVTPISMETLVIFVVFYHSLYILILFGLLVFTAPILSTLAFLSLYRLLVNSKREEQRTLRIGSQESVIVPYNPGPLHGGTVQCTTADTTGN